MRGKAAAHLLLRPLAEKRKEVYRLGGWARIGIVISVLWSALIFGFTGIEYLEFSEEHKRKASFSEGFFFEWQSRPVLDLFPEEEPLDLFTEEKPTRVIEFELQSRRFFIVWLSPIISLWIFSFVLVRTYRWVKAGFSVPKHRS